jgi:hypothetical protein
VAPVLGVGIISGGRSLTEEEAEARFRGQVILVQIELPAYGANPALTLRLATRRFEDKDGLPWWDRIKVPPAIDYGGGFLETRLHPAAADFVVTDEWIPGQPSGTKFSDLLVDYEFTGARVWIRQAFTDLNLFSEYPTIFDGEITEWDDADALEVPFHAVHRRGWNILFPDVVVTEAAWPNAPASARGVPYPHLWGDGRGRRYLTHPTLPNTFEAADFGIARGALPLLPIDAPTAAGGLVLPKTMVSGRDIDGSNPLDERWFMVEGALSRLAGPGSATLTNPAGGPATLVLDSTTTKVAIIPIDVEPGTPTEASGVQEALREDKAYTLEGVTQFDHDANLRLARWALPDVSPLGKFISCDLLIAYAKNSWTGTLGDALVQNRLTAGVAGTAFPAGASASYPSPEQFQQVTTIPVPVSEIIEWADIKNCYIQIRTRAGGQKLQVHRPVLRVAYQAAAKIENPGEQRKTREKRYNARGQEIEEKDIYTGTGVIAGYSNRGSTVDLLSFDHPLLGYFRGKLDTDGSITGTAGTLIEHPVDIAHDYLHLIGVPAGEVSASPGIFGSFADAKTAVGLNYKMLVPLTKQTNAAQFLDDLGSQSLCWFRRRGTEATAPFVALPWEVGLSPDYRTPADPFVFAKTTPWMREGSLKRFRTRISDVINCLRVEFDWDARTNTYGGAVYVTDTERRSYVGGFIDDFVTTDYDGRLARAAASSARYGKREHVVRLPWVVDAESATSYLHRMFDLVIEPRVGVRFDTFVNAYDLEVGHRIELSDDWNSTVSFPRPGSDGSWGGKSFFVVNVKRPRDRPVIYEVEAVEITT